MSLEVQGLEFGYRQALTAPIDFRAGDGEVLGVLGPSGVGKSTMLATVAGLLAPLGGRVILGGRDVTDEPAHTRGIGLMFQEPLLFTHLDARDNVAYGLRRKGIAKSLARAESEALLAWAGLSGFERADVATLSGGQAQRVALARALAPQPRALLLDEPFSALDAVLRIRLGDEVMALLRERGIPVVYVTHDEQEAERVCDRMLRLA